MPVTKIIKTFVDQVPYTEKGQIIYADRDLAGFYLIVGLRTKTYAAQRDIAGRTIRVNIGRHGHFTPEEARKIAKDKLYLMSLGVNPNEEEAQQRAKSITLEKVLESYFVTRKSLKPRTKTDYQYYFDSHLGDWKHKVITEISKDMIGARHAHIAERSGPTTANKTMRILRALFNFAHATFGVCEINPVVYLTHVRGWYKETRKRTYIKPHDLKAWWLAVQELENDIYRDFLILLLFTGLRRSEAARLRWVDIDFKDKTFTIPETKNGDPLTLPMSEFLVGMLEERRKQYGNYEFVFPGPGEGGYLAEPKKGINKVIKASGVSFSCHDLRRTFVTIAESLEISQYALKRLLNHRLTDITSSYIIIDVERLRGPVEKIAAFITGQVCNGRPL
ncbi:MAG: phage integrase family protein [Micavibrio sp.]|nr:phage integrase family protein [Micavibrio sp.]